MALFQKREYNTPEEKKLSVVRFWFFAVAVFSFVIPFALLFVLNMANREGLYAFALKPSLIIFIIVDAILVVTYFIYRAILLKNQS